MVLLYRQVYEGLLSDIRNGTFAVGDKLPLVAELTAKFSVSSITLKHALDLLRDDGYISRRPRVGTIVISTNPSPAPEPRGKNRPMVGCVLTSFDDTFGTRVMEGILGEAGLDAHLLLKRSGGSIDEEDKAIRALVDAGVAGLILLPSTSQFIPPAALELVMKRFPVVILDRSYDGIPVSTVFSDNFESAKVATEYLLDLGHERVGFIASASRVSTNDERENGYVRAHAMRHLPLPATSELRTLQSTLPGATATIDDDIASLMEFLTANADVTAFLVTEYNIAVLLRQACRILGLSVPDDVSIICFDHPIAFADQGLFRFTHVEQDQHALGRRAMEQVLAQIEDRNDVEKVIVPSTLVSGQSTSKP
ncbi:GntR family transcriptional regulator [Glaciihabitans sp. UYNi722]|uniref:GntR family transcriptional regulator n=1 Tax=Glaciihabitans sp. UYNi722 TaxID=3156344 RepID=UPI00339878E5